jgi:hypothetical protein
MPSIRPPSIFDTPLVRSTTSRWPRRTFEPRVTTTFPTSVTVFSRSSRSALQLYPGRLPDRAALRWDRARPCPLAQACAHDGRRSTSCYSSPPLKALTEKSDAIAVALSNFNSWSASNECLRCGETMFFPEWSGYLDRYRIQHLWECEACGHKFKTLVSLS